MYILLTRRNLGIYLLSYIPFKLSMSYSFIVYDLNSFDVYN